MPGIHRLQVSELTTLGPGFHSDGNCLYLCVERNKAGDGFNRHWVFRFERQRRLRDMGLGSLLDFGADRQGLDFVRRLAIGNKMLLAEGTDPIEARRQQAKAVAVVAVPTFEEMARQYIDSHKDEWRSAKHGKQWESTLRNYVYPVIGNISVDRIEVAHVQKVLMPIWNSKTETATRVRNRIELILDSAAALKYRQGDNPARWRGNLKSLLAKPSKIAKVEHHAAMDYRGVGAFMQVLRQRKGSAALALEFCILTCSRTNEVLRATWDEIDMAESRWTVPAGRIKSEREHDVPLSKRALEILCQARAINPASKYLFPNRETGRHLSPGALLALLQAKMKRPELTVHGFRSAFRDWVGEETNFPGDLAEMALAHQVGDKTERAYRRGNGFIKRVKLAEAWASYCSKVATVAADGQVVAFRRS
jgi:integrase